MPRNTTYPCHTTTLLLLLKYILLWNIIDLCRNVLYSSYTNIPFPCFGHKNISQRTAIPQASYSIKQWTLSERQFEFEIFPDMLWDPVELIKIPRSTPNYRVRCQQSPVPPSFTIKNTDSLLSRIWKIDFRLWYMWK